MQLADSIDDPFAADLMRAIVGAMTCRNPKLGMLMLGAQVAVALRNRDVRRRLQVTPLRDDIARLPQWRRALCRADTAAANAGHAGVE